IVAVDRSVQHRHRTQRIDGGFDDERQIRQLRSHSLVLGLLGLANLSDAAEVHLEHRVHMRRRAPAQDHVLGDFFSHHRHRDDLSRNADVCGRRRHTFLCALTHLPYLPYLPYPTYLTYLTYPTYLTYLTYLPGLPDVGEDVFFRDASGDARALKLRDVDIVFSRDLPHQRGRTLADGVLGR